MRITTETLNSPRLLNLKAVIPNIIPKMTGPGAPVYADSTNINDKTAYAHVNDNIAVYQFPLAFLNRVEDVTYFMGTTEVFR